MKNDDNPMPEETAGLQALWMKMRMNISWSAICKSK